jgi:hypothetical protein
MMMNVGRSILVLRNLFVNMIFHTYHGVYIELCGHTIASSARSGSLNEWPSFGAPWSLPSLLTGRRAQEYKSLLRN